MAAGAKLLASSTSCLIVAQMAGLPLLPPVLVASLVSLLLTGRVSMIESQRERESEDQHG